MLGSVKQSVKQNAIISTDFERGEVSELADEHDLGSCPARGGGSSPPFPTMPSGESTSQRSKRNPRRQKHPEKAWV